MLLWDPMVLRARLHDIRTIEVPPARVTRGERPNGLRARRNPLRDAQRAGEASLFSPGSCLAPFAVAVGGRFPPSHEACMRRRQRFAVALPLGTKDLVRRVAALRGVSVAQVVVEVMEAAAPVLERTARALERVKAKNESKAEVIREALVKAEVDANTAAAAAMAVLERIAAREVAAGLPGAPSVALKRRRLRK